MVKVKDEQEIMDEPKEEESDVIEEEDIDVPGSHLEM